MVADRRQDSPDSSTPPPLLFSPTLCSVSVGWTADAYLEHVDIARLQTRVAKDLLSAPLREVESAQVGKAVRRSVEHTPHDTHKG
jgi:hypothetical protein